jgi:hypothetical protein
MAFELIDLSTKLKQATVGDLLRTVNAVNRLKDVRFMIAIPRLSLRYSQTPLCVTFEVGLEVL